MAKSHTDIAPLSRRAAIIDMLKQRQAGRELRITVQTILDHLRMEWGDTGLPTTKTLHRDIDALQRELGEDHLYWNSSAQSYELTGATDMHEVELSYSAAFLGSDHTAGHLFLARQSLRQLEGTPFHPGAKQVFDALCSTGSERTRKRYEKLASRIYFEHPPPQAIDTTVWEDITRALDSEKRLHIHYCNAEGEDSHRKVDPLGLVVSDQLWQLVAYDYKRRAIRTFRLSRISRTQPSMENTWSPKHFDLESYMEGSLLGYQTSGPTHHIHLRYTVKGSHAGRDHHWTAVEKRWTDEKNRLHVKFKASALFRIASEVLSWGGAIEVVEPPELRDMVRKKVDALKRIHS